MRKPQQDYKTVRVRGTGGAEWTMDLTPRVERLIARKELTVLGKQKATATTPEPAASDKEAEDG